MVGAEAHAIKAFHAFYDALDALLRGQGTQPMSQAWHHADYVSSSHPYGDWAFGWAEVWATWQEGAAVWAHYHGHADRSDRICGIQDLQVKVHGDTAYGASVYRSKFYMSEGELNLKVNCSDVLHLIDGAWKVVHHHADQAPPAWQARIEKMVQLGHS
ncbi:MAG TPA: nuclear transport factor 2 family protein [Polyangiaceae bacterium]|nr:nuclear transport factor 2 family protein [Polyangiaceae bacterium]